MAITSNTYAGNGSNKLFSITFPYLETTDVDVYLNGTLQTVTTQYTFANATTIEFVVAPGNGVTVILQRSTNKESLNSTFFPGSSIKSADLNENFDQLLYISQENTDIVNNLPSTVTLLRWTKTATAGQTVLTGFDNYAVSLSYRAGFEQIYLNGAHLTRNIDYTAADGVTITMSVALVAGDLVEVMAYAPTSVSTIDSTGVNFTQSGTGAVTRNVDSKLKELVSVKDFGAVGDGTTNDTAAINLAVASGKSLQWPQGTYRVTSSIVCTANQTWMAAGEVTINYDAASASAAAPVLDFREEVHIDGDFIVNHNANTKAFITPAVYNGNIIAGSAVLIQGDYSTVNNIQVRNAWDNGIAVVKLNPTTGAETAGSPKYVALSNIRTISCGVGEHTAPALTPGKIGGGIDIGSGSACTVSNCIDNGSYIGFILDLGAGGQAMFSNCVAFYTKRDSSNLTNGSGYGFFVGSGDSAFVNCYSIGSDYRGWWYDATANNCDFVNCAAYIPKYEGLFIKGSSAQFENFRIKGASFVGSGTADAVLIDSSAGSITELQLEVQTTGSNHRYGVNLSGANQIDAFITGNLSGITRKINNLLSYEIGLHLFDTVNGVKQAFNRADAGFAFDFYGKHRVSASAANASYISSIFGDSGNNGTVFVEDFATPAKRAAFGYDPTNDGFVIQSIQSGVAKKPLFLNPSGGQVMLGKGEWTDPARLGNYYLWVDGSGKLRIKSGVPTSDGDGTVVGTQT